MQARGLRTVCITLLVGAIVSSSISVSAQPGTGANGGYGRPPFPRHYGGMGGWDRQYGANPDREGSWGGWSRPNHRFRRYGWGSWATPYYAGGPGYSSANMDTVDEQGSLYTARTYYIPDPNSIVVPNVTGPYGWTSGSVTMKSEAERKKAQPKIERVTVQSKFKLGPDTDVLDGGIIALHLTTDACLVVTADNTRLVDRTGVVLITLATDPTLLWHLGSEIERQSLALKAALARKKSVTNAAQCTQVKQSTSTSDSSDTTEAQKVKSQDTASSVNSTTSSSTQTSSADATKSALEAKNLSDSITLLELAANKLGKHPADLPAPVKPPDPDSLEIFASVWISSDGHFISFKGPDGTVAYIDNKGIYSDRGKKPIKIPYPGKFEVAVYGFLKNLLSEADKTMDNLKEEQENASWSLRALTDDFQSANQSPKAQTDTAYQSPFLEAQARMVERLESINSQLKSMPEEIAAAKNAVAMFSED